MNWFPLVVFNYGAIQIDADSLTVLLYVSFLKIKRLDFAANQALALARLGLKVVRVGHILEVAREEFLLGISKQFTESRRNLQPPSVQAYVSDHYQRESFSACQPGFALT